MNLLASIPKWCMLLCFLGLNFSLQGQGWYKSYSDLYPEIWDDWYNVKVDPFEGIIETEDLGYITWGREGYYYPNYIFPNQYYSPDYANIDVILTKLDVAGNEQWTVVHENGSSPAFTDLDRIEMVNSPDGNGYMIFAKVRTESGPSIFRSIQLDETGAFINSFDYSEDELMDITPDPTGSSNTAGTTMLIEIIPSPDNTFLVLGSNNGDVADSNPSMNPSWLSKIDMNGNVLWGTVFNDQFSTLELGTTSDPTDSTSIMLMLTGLDVFPNGEIVATGVTHFNSYNRKVLFKYDTNGNEIWSQNGSAHYSNRYTKVIAHPEGDIFVHGYESIYGWSNKMSRLTADGDTLWTDTTQANSGVVDEFAPIDFCLLPDGNIGIVEIQSGLTPVSSVRFKTIDVDNNDLMVGTPFPFALSSVLPFTPTGVLPYDRAQLLATINNTMVFAGLSINYPSLSFPFIINSGTDGNIPLSRLSGNVFVDSNNNCIYDPGEVGIPNTVVYTGLNNGLTDDNGSYEIDIVDGNDYTITTSFGTGYPSDLWGTNCPDSLQIIDSSGDFIADFGFYPLNECPRLTVDLNLPFLRTGLTNTASISYANVGTAAADSVTIYLNMDELFSVNPDGDPFPFSYDSLGIPYSDPDGNWVDFTYDSVNNTYAFFIGTLDLFETGFIRFGIDVSEDALVGSSPCFQASILPVNYCGLESLDWDGSELEVAGSCEGDSVVFVIENIGDGDMGMLKTYAIYADDLLIQSDDVILDAGESETITQLATGATYHITVEQSSDFPEPSFPSAVVEACNYGNVQAELITLGFVNSMPHNDQASHIDIECRKVTGPFADNDDITVFPSGVSSQKYVNSNVESEYTIRFQNTGNSITSNVFVIDTLPDFLDISTFMAGPASHDYEVTMLPGGVVRWDFPDISLPTSATDIDASSVAITFKIKIEAGIAQPTEITNQASIFFDSQPPRITESVFITVCDECLLEVLGSTGIYFDGKVLLEGAYNGAGLMTNNLQDLIPIDQPFTNFPYLYEGNEKLTEIPANMVDWVLVEARSGTPNSGGGTRATTTVETQAAILFNDGSIRGLDGISGVKFQNLSSDTPYHFCIRHRNHLDVLTATALLPNDNMVYDFTTGVSKAMGAAQMKWFGGDTKAVMYSGDFNGDGVIQTTDYDVWAIQPAAVEVYDLPDANLDGVIQVSDFDKWFFNKAKVGNVEIGF